MKLFNEITNRNELADLLDIPLQLLTYTLYSKKEKDLYTSFEIPKKSSGVRIINAPIDPLKSIQIKLSEELTKYIQFVIDRDSINTNISHGFIPGRSIITNAEIHRNKQYVLNLDIKDYFPSFHFGRVKGFFEKNKYFNLSSEVAVMIAQITCYKGALPQGAPTSPIIANLISNILDFRILKLAKKYKLDYTRYADDLSFSTNNQSFLDRYSAFLEELKFIIDNAGFQINNNKTRLQYKDSRQEVTGLTVNKKINSKKEFRKNTRAMAHSLYTTGSFHLEDGSEGTLEQLDGRFSFINHFDWYNTFSQGYKSQNYFRELTSRERDYRDFLFYKRFMANEKPLLVTEGKTDIKYLKAAIKGLYREFPNSGQIDSSNEFSYKISFFDRFEYEKKIQHHRRIPKQNILKDFFNIDSYGADTMKNIFNLYTGAHNYPDLRRIFIDEFNIIPSNPVILVFDNEQSKDYPLTQFLNNINQKKYVINTVKVKENIKEKNFSHIISNLYVLTLPRINNEDTEIEDLLVEKDIRYFKASNGIQVGSNIKESQKNSLANYIFNNYHKTDFQKFRPLLGILDNIMGAFNSNS